MVQHSVSVSHRLVSRESEDLSLIVNPSQVDDDSHHHIARLNISRKVACIYELLQADKTRYIGLQHTIHSKLVVLDHSTSRVRLEAKEERARQVILHCGEREQRADKARRGLQKINEETKHIGIGPISGRSHGNRAHDNEMVDSQVSFFYALVDELPMALRKMSPRASPPVCPSSGRSIQLGSRV